MAASDSTGKIVTLVVVVGGAFALYEWLKSQCATPGSMMYGNSMCGTLGLTTGIATVATPAPIITSSPTLPVVAITTGAGDNPTLPGISPAAPPLSNTAQTSNLASLLQAAAGNVSTLNADQWSYYYATLPGRSAISATTFSNLFFPGGRPSDASQYPQYTAAQFAAMAQGAGLSGWYGMGDAMGTGNTTAQPLTAWQRFESLFGGGNSNPANAIAMYAPPVAQLTSGGDNPVFQPIQSVPMLTGAGDNPQLMPGARYAYNPAMLYPGPVMPPAVYGGPLGIRGLGDDVGIPAMFINGGR